MALTNDQKNWVRARRDEMLTYIDAQDVASGDPRDFPSGAIILKQGNDTILAECFGTRNVARTKPYTLDTITSVRSVTKGFTGAVVAKLVEEGRMSYNDVMESFPTINDHVKGVMPLQSKGADNAVEDPIQVQLTVRHFLCHTNGTSNSWSMDAMYGLPAPNSGSPDMDSTATFIAEGSGAYPYAFTFPATYNDKSTYFAALAAEDAAKASGRTVWKYTEMVQEMFAKLGMKNSYIGFRPDTRSNTDHATVLDVSGDPDSYDFAENITATNPPGMTVGLEQALMGKVSGNYGIDAARLLGYAGAYISANDLMTFAHNIWRPGKYLMTQAAIDNYLFDYDQSGNYWNNSQLNDGVNPVNTGPNAGNNNGCNPPFRGWSLGGYIYKTVNGYEGISNEGSGGNGPGGLWISCPDLDLSIVGVKCSTNTPYIQAGAWVGTFYEDYINTFG